MVRDLRFLVRAAVQLARHRRAAALDESAVSAGKQKSLRVELRDEDACGTRAGKAAICEKQGRRAHRDGKVGARPGGLGGEDGSRMLGGGFGRLGGSRTLLQCETDVTDAGPTELT